jgi:hypothetical protein
LVILNTQKTFLKMKLKLWLIIGVMLAGGPVLAKKYLVFYLGGQSNMNGFGYNSELPDELKQAVKGVYIFHGNMANDNALDGGIGVWAELQPGHGTQHKATTEVNQYSERFGIELTFATEMKKLFPNENIALIKYARGGSSIHIDAARDFGCWEPDYFKGNGINQYDHFLTTINNAFAATDIDKDGEPDELIPTGIVWMQGESDAAFAPEIAKQYTQNLKRLIDLFRAALRNDDLPVVVGRISDSGQDETDGLVWDYGEEVRRQQAKFVNTDRNAALVKSTDSYGYSDKWHYNTEGYLDLGKQFAKKMAELHNKTP